MSTRGTWHLHAKQRGLRRNRLCRHLDPASSPQAWERINSCCLSAPCGAQLLPPQDTARGPSPLPRAGPAAPHPEPRAPEAPHLPQWLTPPGPAAGPGKSSWVQPWAGLPRGTGSLTPVTRVYGVHRAFLRRCGGWEGVPTFQRRERRLTGFVPGPRPAGASGTRMLPCVPRLSNLEDSPSARRRGVT